MKTWVTSFSNSKIPCLPNSRSNENLFSLQVDVDVNAALKFVGFNSKAENNHSTRYGYDVDYKMEGLRSEIQSTQTPEK